MSNSLVRRKKAGAQLEKSRRKSLEKGKTMFFSKSMAFDEEKTANPASSALTRVRTAVEAEFIERLKTGEAAAFDLLVTRYSADIYALLVRLTQNQEEAADLTQETFLHALGAIKNFRGESELKTWLFRIAVNQSRNRFRWWTRRRRDYTISLDAPVNGTETPLGDTFSGDAKSPEQDVLRRERETALRSALENLPEAYREAVILCDIEGLSYEEIAHALGINVGTVKSRIARGREELRRRLKDI